MVNSIHDYVAKGDETQVKHWLSVCLDVDELDSERRTPLFTTVEHNNIALATLILKRSPNTNLADKQKRHPLHIAIESQNYKMCELLLAGRADPDKRNAAGDNALSLTCQMPGWDAAKGKVVQLLLKHGCTASFVNPKGDTPLHIAARAGLHHLAQILIDASAPVDQVNAKGETPLHAAVSSGHLDTVSTILKRTSKLGARTKDGNTALQMAEKSFPEIAALIMAVKAQKVPWREVKAEGKWPVPRTNHAAAVYKNRWYIHGGENDFAGGGTINADMHFLNGDTKEWRLLAPRGKAQPPALCRHTAVMFGSKMYIFGGTDGAKTYNDIWRLDLEQMAWAREEIEGPYLIRPRCGHTMTKISPTQFLVLGGSSGSDYFNDAHVYDILTRKWERKECLQPPPAKRHCHTATVCDGSVYLFGGNHGDDYFNDVFLLSLDTWSWFELEVRGVIPLARTGHSAQLINNSVILYYGGMDCEKETLVDMRCLDLNSYSWIKYDTSSSKNQQALHRVGHTMEIVGTSIYVFGGNTMFCLHELLPYVLDSQAMPIPIEVEEERKIVAKPPVPEKPTGPPPIKHTKEHSEKLQGFVVDLLSLIKNSDPPLPASHPLHAKCSEVEAYFASLGASEVVKAPSLPPKPAPPPKIVTAVKKAPEELEASKKSGRSVRRRAPRTTQNALPSVVLKELTTHLTSGGTRGANRRGFPRGGPRGRGASRDQAAAHSPTYTAPLTPPPVSPRGPKVPARTRAHGSDPHINLGSAAPQSPETKVRVRRRPAAALDARSVVASVPRGAAPCLPPRSPSVPSSVTHPQSGGSSPAIPAKPRPRGQTVAARPVMKAPKDQIGAAPSLMITDDLEEEEAPEPTPEPGPRKIAHTQPTQYVLPPGPSNLAQHYETVLQQIPVRSKFVMTEFKDKKDKMLYEVVNELLTTEESYLRDLAVLIGMFKKPLQHEYEGCVPPHYLELLFSNAEDLFELNIALFQELLEAEQRRQSVGLSFMRVINRFPQYNMYCTNQRSAVEALQKLQKVNKPFVEFIARMEAADECQRQNISSYMIKPFQRVTRYPLLLKELLKQTSKGTADHQHLSDTVARIDTIVKAANEEKRVNDSVIMMIEIQKSFEWQGEDGQLHFSPDCKFLLEAKFKEVEPKTHKMAKRRFFLFNDMLVVAKEVGKKYKKLAVIPLDSCIIWDIKAGSSEIRTDTGRSPAQELTQEGAGRVAKTVKNAFSIVRTDKTEAGTNGKLVMCAKTDTDKEMWINAINSAIAAYMTPEMK